MVGTVYFDRNQLKIEWLSAARRLALATASVVSRIAPDSRLVTEEQLIRDIARGIAVAIHTTLHVAHDRGRVQNEPA